jgi:hypothetical protein
MKIKRVFNFFPEKLKHALNGYEEFYHQEIENKIAELWEVDDGESYAITRLEYDEYKDFTVLVVCCYEGKKIKEFADHVEKVADKKKWYVRVHTTNKALCEWWRKRYHFDEIEYVLTREPKNG